jgi:tetraacyldisaccharide 4'-kinase
MFQVSPALLAPLAMLYGGAIRARNWYFDCVASAARHATVPVISVGNLTVGGTGKTPLVIEIVRRLVLSGRRPAILTRGYKAAAGAPADEVLEFSTAFPNVPVVVNANRVAGAVTAQQKHRANCLVLDDGFQHRRLHRDLDIVLIDALNPWGGGRLLPAGRLREPPSSLRRADVFVITRVNQAEHGAVAAIAGVLRHHAGDKPLVLAALEAESLTFPDAASRPPTDIAGRPVLAVSGIGNPRTFEKLVESLAGQPAEYLRFADHHRYDPNDVARIVAAAGDNWVVTTRKDWVKLCPLWPDRGPPLVRLDMKLTLTAGAPEFDARLRAVCGTGS